MLNIKKIRIIVKSLMNEKNQHLNQLGKINSTINNKNEVLNKLKTYQASYLNDKTLETSKTIPSLHDNFEKFVKKMGSIALSAEAEINSLIAKRNSVLVEIEKLDQKIDILNHYEAKINLNQRLLDDKYEQRMIDDMVTTLEGGDQNE